MLKPHPNKNLQIYSFFMYFLRSNVVIYRPGLRGTKGTWGGERARGTNSLEEAWTKPESDNGVLFIFKQIALYLIGFRRKTRAVFRNVVAKSWNLREEAKVCPQGESPWPDAAAMGGRGTKREEKHFVTAYTIATGGKCLYPSLKAQSTPPASGLEEKSFSNKITTWIQILRN